MTAAKKQLESVPDEAPTFTFTPTVGDKIVFPSFRSVKGVDKAFLWKIHKMTLLSQSWECMDLAGVPDEVQARCQQLPDDEYKKLFDDWWGEVGASAGE